MRRLIYDKLRINEWLWKRVGRERPFGPFVGYQAIGVEEDGELIAGVVFDSFSTEARCSMHCAGIGKRWCTRELLQACFEYVFIDAKCKVVINTVSSANEESIRFTKHVGFKEMTRIPNGAGDSDLVILALHRSDCRWLGVENVQVA
jgi:RimJ/RimL family protein N-acetyltransferase